MEIKNGSTVHRIWATPTGYLSDAELIGVFQYIGDAETFCKAKLEREPENCALAAVCHYSGKMSLFFKPKAAPQ